MYKMQHIDKAIPIPRGKSRWGFFTCNMDSKNDDKFKKLERPTKISVAWIYMVWSNLKKIKPWMMYNPYMCVHV